MELHPLPTKRLTVGDELTAALAESDIKAGDIIAVSAKVIAAVEGAAIRLSDLTPDDEAKCWLQELTKTDQNAGFVQAIVNETRRMNGQIVGACPYALLTELRPDGLAEGTVMAVNAGLDRSNVETGYAIGWPIDPVSSLQAIRRQLEEKVQGTLGVLLTDSCCRPRRQGVTAMGLVTSGFSGLNSQIGRPDLYDHPIRVTQEAVADQLACAANFLMGNADQSVPAVAIRGHGLTLQPDLTEWVPGIELENDLFRDMFKTAT